MRSGLLAHDLMRLGTTPLQIAELPQRFATFTSAPEALGWMYVVERAILVHAGVRRHLAQHLPEAHCASSYLSAYDGVASQRWAELGTALEAIARTPAMIRQVVTAAKHGFDALRAWFHDGAAAPVAS